MSSPTTAPLRPLTHDIPPIGGRLRERFEDFLVEEIPLYNPCGEGEHIYLFVEKRDLSTSQLVWHIARHFDVRRTAVGFAGMKDKRAITRQVISVHTPGRTFEDYPMIQSDRISVLWADMHTNKLRLGHLSGNRFSVKVRGVDMSRVLQARRVLLRLAEKGVPNFAGEQRFGARANNHELGRLLLRRDWQGLLDELLGPGSGAAHINAEARRLYAEGRITESLDAYPVSCRHERVALAALERQKTPQQAVQAIDIVQRRFWVSAFQSSLFNNLLSARMADDLFDRLVEGDVAAKRDNGAMFAVDSSVLADPQTAERLARFEISPTGPIWGSEMMRASGAVDAAETEALARTGVTIDALARYVSTEGGSMRGGRRPFRVPLVDPDVEGGVDEHGHYVRCAFELPPGAYATVVMREVMKNDLLEEGQGSDGSDDAGDESE